MENGCQEVGVTLWCRPILGWMHQKNENFSDIGTISQNAYLINGVETHSEMKLP
jgi:hypothetical protein